MLCNIESVTGLFTRAYALRAEHSEQVYINCARKMKQDSAFIGTGTYIWVFCSLASIIVKGLAIQLGVGAWYGALLTLSISQRVC